MEGTLKKAAVAAGVAAVVGGIYYLLQPAEEAPKKANSRKPPSPPPMPKAVRYSKSEILSMLEQIKTAYKNRILELNEWYVTSRRQVRGDLEKYSSIVKEYLEKLNRVNKESVDEVFLGKNIDRKRYEESLDELKNDPDVNSAMDSIKAEVSSGEPLEDLDADKIVEVLNFKLEELKKLEPSPDEVSKTQQIAELEDKIHEKFGYEMKRIQATFNKFKSKVRPFVRSLNAEYQRLGLTN